MRDAETYSAEVEHGSAATTISPRRDAWSFPLRIVFRFTFVYLVLYCLPGTGRVSLLEALPVGEEFLTQQAEQPWHALCPWVAVHIFRLAGPVTRYHPTGSGDTTLDYIQVFCFLVIAALITLVWSIVDRRRTHYLTLYAWLRLLVRFTLAFTLLAYGFAKVFPLQFSTPGLSRLTETYGESSPMGLLWTFMGASQAYTIFGGLAEVTGGVLLLFRRMTTLGALITAGVMLNIVALNFCYDVPVKLYSVHLLLMALFLLIPDAPALWNFFVHHRLSRPQGVWLPPFKRRALRVSAIVLQVLVIGSVLYNNIWGAYKATKSYAAQFKHPSIYGIWHIDTFIVNGWPLTAAPDDERWQRMIVGSANYLTVRTSGNTSLMFHTTYNSAKHDVTLKGVQNHHAGEFTYKQSDKQHLLLTGSLDRNAVVLQLHRYDTNQFLLTSRGFHWINDDPFNR